MNNQIKMIVTDLDKTLLDNNCNISEYSRSILTKCMDKNIIVVFATARPIRATVIYYPVLKPHAIICHNGAKILADDNTIYQCGIRKEVYNNIIDKLTRHFPGFNIAIEINDKIYANYDPSVYWGKIDYENLNSRPDENADKIIVGLGDKTNIDEIEKYLPEYLYLERSRGSVEGNLALIMNKAATKWNAVRELSKYHNIDTENIAAFGDNENDLDMVRNCGMGVAVENAIDEVKNAAKGICDSNDKDGVANWIEKNILLCQ